MKRNISKACLLSAFLSLYLCPIYAQPVAQKPEQTTAGKTWQKLTTEPYPGKQDDICFVNENLGWYINGYGKIFHTIAESHALILQTTDGGLTWKKVYESNRPFETTWKVSFPSRQIGYVTIQSYNPDASVTQQRIAKTTDGGNTWTEINLVENAQAREFGIGFITNDHGFVGTMNSGYETKDGGQTWQPVAMGRALNKIRFYKAGSGSIYGYAIGVDVWKW